VPVPTVAEVLAMPAVRGAGPRVVAGQQGLGRQVRWVHSAELADIAPLLRGGDLLLSTGIALPSTGAELVQFAVSLGESDAAGLAIELGRRWMALPESLIRTCDEVGLPLVALTREVRFAAIAQAVGERIVYEQLSELREAQHVHETFTELTTSEAGPHDILDAVQRMAGSSVVLENEQHQVLDYRAGPGNISEFLARWSARSRAVPLDGRTSWDSGTGWLLTRVGRRERGWGRLIIESPALPSQRLTAIAERAAAALAMHRLHDRHRDSLVRRTHHELLLGLLTDSTSPDVLRRLDLAGFPAFRRHFVGLTLRPQLDMGANQDGSTATAVDDIIATVVHAADRLRAPALVCEIDRDVQVLLATGVTGSADRVADELARLVLRRHRVIIAAGRPATRTADIDRSLREAQHVAASVRPDATVSKAVHRLEDVHIRGLLTLLGDDERVLHFINRELGTLREYDTRWATGYVATLRAFFQHSGSKSAAADSLHISRAVLYDRLSKISRLLSVNLDDADIRASLHVALIADELRREPR
jgi:PucR family transcriptional regulator, purine catabolism regulatory protein